MYSILNETTLLHEDGFFAVVHDRYLKNILGLKKYRRVTKRILSKMTPEQRAQQRKFEERIVIFTHPFGEEWWYHAPSYKRKNSNMLDTMKLVCQSQLAAKDRAKFLERTYSGLKGSPFFAFSIGACYFDSDKSSIFGQILMVFDRKSGKACAAFVPQDIVQFIADELASFYRASPKPSFLAKLSQELKSLGTDYIAPIVQSVTGWTKDVVRKMVYRAFQWHVPNPYFYLGSRIISDQAHRDDDEH